MCSALGVANPSCYADREIELQVTRQLAMTRGETVRDAAREAASVLAQNRLEVIMGIALVQKNGFADPASHLKLAMERFPLYRPWGEVTEIIESAFADGHDLGKSRKLLQLRQQLSGQIRGMMRVNAGRCE
jgi:hypothetical protein